MATGHGWSSGLKRQLTKFPSIARMENPPVLPLSVQSSASLRKSSSRHREFVVVRMTHIDDQNAVVAQKLMEGFRFVGVGQVSR